MKHVKEQYPSVRQRFARRLGVRVRAAAAGTVILAVVAACGSAGATGSSSAATGDATPVASAGTVAQTKVTLVTHDSFAVDPAVLAAFEKKSGITVTVLAQGDAGEMLSKAIVTKGNPLGDAVFGIDNTFATKALEAGILAPYASPLAKNGADAYAIPSGDSSGGSPENRLSAIDFGDVCVNVDHQYFKKHGLVEPTTFEDLAKPEYKNLLVTEDAATSSPGLAFLLGTIAHFGADGWQAYWKSLVANGLKVDSGWNNAYSVDFSGSSGHGDRPMVVSYASSPPAEVPKGATEAPTGALLNTCFRQVEYAGVLAGAKNPQGAEKVVDFLLSDAFQTQIPEQMYMYPVDRSAKLPADWAAYAPIAKNPEKLGASNIDAHRQQWIDAFADIVHG